MNIINETTDILLSSGYSEYCIRADRDIEISFRGYEKSEVYICIEKAKKVIIRSFAGKNSDIKFLLWNNTASLLDINETYDVMQNSNVVVAYGECNEADTKRNTYMALRGENATGKLSSALLVKNKKDIKLQLVNFAKRTTGNIENYGVVLKDGKLMIDAIGKIVKGASRSESHQSSRAMSFASGQSTTILPELLIDENDVQASHAMSIGRVDENQLYYMMSRGLSVEACTALISTGYLMPITRVLEDKELSEKLTKRNGKEDGRVMLDVEKIRLDFPMIQNHPDLVYFDNGATTLKPKAVIDAVSNFYEYSTTNVHRGDYTLAAKTDALYDSARDVVAKFINCQSKEVAFMHNDTEVMNQIAYGLKSFWLQKGDVVLTTENEHASNLLPWYRLEKEIGIKVEYIPVGKDGVIHIEDAAKAMHDKVKVISIAEVTNVLGALQPVKELAKLAHQNHAYIVVDGAQSVPHHKTDVQDADIDFLAFSAHKMCGPSGVGVLYGKFDLLEKMEPMLLGGGMNSRFESCGDMLLKPAPTKFEAGTPNIEGVIGCKAAIEYLDSIGMDNIEEYEKELRVYFAEKVKKLDNIEFYNPDNIHGPVIFNAKGVFAQDAASFLSSKNIAVRSGNHCAKILHEIIGTDATIRASLYFYNTKEEVDKCIAAMKEITLENAIGIFF